MSGAPRGIESDFPLSRLTTVRTGGTAEYFARPATVAALRRCLCWAAEERLKVGVVGSGSNLLIADAGVHGLVLKLERGLAAIEVDGERLLCGGGARLPRAAAKSASLGLSGLEFGVNIPGTVGGAVKMNANAYGGELATVLEWVDVVTTTAVVRRTPEQLDFRYRRSNLGPDEVVARASFVSTRGDPKAIKSRLQLMRAQRKATQPAGIKTFGSTFKNPQGSVAAGRTAGQLLEAAGCRGLAVGGARFSPKHANFIENTGAATTADVVALMAAGKRRVAEWFGVELEPEVQTLGLIDWSAELRPDRPEEDQDV